MTDIDIATLIPKELQSQFWVDFCDAFSEEIALMRSEFQKKQDYYNVRNLTVNDEDLLNEIFLTFGYQPDFSVRSDIDFIKQEIRTLVFKVKRKTSYSIYDYIFRTIPITGYVYNIFWDSYVLAKAIDTVQTNTELNSHDYTKVFEKVIPEYYFSKLKAETFSLDNNFSLDDGYFLDIDVLKQTTHHLAIEIVPTSLMFYEDSTLPYIMSLSYLNYILYMCNYSKKVTEIPHVGFQINLITDDSRYYNNLNGGASYTVPDIQANFAVTQNYTGTLPKTETYYLCAGVGTQKMFSISEPLGTIIDLDEQLFSKQLYNNELKGLADWVTVNSYIPVNTIQNLILAIGDGSRSYYEGVLKYGYVIPNSFYVTYTSAGNEITVVDTDKDGVFSASYFNGQIDYNTGGYNIDFFSDFTNTNYQVSAGNVSSISTMLPNINIILDTFSIRYSVLGDNYMAYSNGSGTITGTYITSGTIDSVGNLNIIFSHITDLISINCSYRYYIYLLPDIGTPIIISYKTELPVRLREIGLKDQNGNLLLYATIPTFYLPNSDYHLAVNLFIKK